MYIAIFLGDATGGPIQHSNGLCILPKYDNCFFPKNGEPTDPGDTGKFVLKSDQCDQLKFRPFENNGYLGYYTSQFVGICIGEGRDSHEPVEGDEVMLSKKACQRTESCQHLSCGKNVLFIEW